MSLPFYRIDLNEVPYHDASNIKEPLLVTPACPMKLRKEVERFAIYFRREFGFDFQQFEATEKFEEGEKPYQAYLFINEPNRYPRVWTGACCFRWRNFKDSEARWGMQWIWLHPYYRDHGILTRAWPRFHELHGNFLPEAPFSPAMKKFLLRQGKCIVCWKTVLTNDLVCKRCQRKSRRKPSR